MRLLLTIITVFVCYTVSMGASPITTLGTFKTMVREEVANYDTGGIPDSVLTDGCQRALAWTSTDIGGVEATFKVTLVVDQAFYAVPDSIVEVVHATLMYGDATFPMKAWHPELMEGLTSQNSIEVTAGQIEDVPSGYNVWADTIQIMPTPKRADSLFLKCFVEHRLVTADSMTINLGVPYREAAVFYASATVCRWLQDYDRAEYFRGLYKEAKTVIRANYERKINAILPE